MIKNTSVWWKNKKDNGISPDFRAETSRCSVRVTIAVPGEICRRPHVTYAAEKNFFLCQTGEDIPTFCRTVGFPDSFRRRQRTPTASPRRGICREKTAIQMKIPSGFPQYFHRRGEVFHSLAHGTLQLLIGRAAPVSFLRPPAPDRMRRSATTHRCPRRPVPARRTKIPCAVRRRCR